MITTRAEGQREMTVGKEDKGEKAVEKGQGRAGCGEVTYARGGLGN